jgi:IS30 family transposase
MGKIYEQLSLEERTMIQMQLEAGLSPAAIALGLNLRGTRGDLTNSAL